MKIALSMCEEKCYQLHTAQRQLLRHLNILENGSFRKIEKNLVHYCESNNPIDYTLIQTSHDTTTAAATSTYSGKRVLSGKERTSIIKSIVN